MTRIRKFIPAFLLFLAVTAASGQSAQMSSAIEAIEKGEYETALTVLDGIIKREPRNDTAYAQKARVYIRQNRLELALPEAEKALRLNPRNFEALNARGVVKREQLKDRRGALADFEQATAIRPDYYFAALNQGITLSMLGRLSEASAAFDRAAAIAPGNPAPYLERARFLTVFGLNSTAIPDYDKAVRLGPNNADYYALRAYNRFRLYISGKAATADFDSDIDRALGIDPKNALALAVRSMVRPRSAAADAQNAINFNPNGFLGYVARGFVKADNKEFDSSAEDFEKALSLAPGDKWIAEKLDAVLQRATGPRAVALKAEIAKARKEAAEAELDSAQKNVIDNPWDFGVYDALGNAASEALRNGATFDRKAFLEARLAENPKNICVIRFLGEYKARNYMEMINFWNDGLSLYDGRNGTECAAELAFRIGREYSGRNRFDEAKPYFERAKELKPDLRYLDQNIASNDAGKTAEERRKAEWAAMSVPAPVPAPAERKPEPKVKPCTRTEIEAAIRAYGWRHPSIEADFNEYNRAVDKYQRAGGYRYLYRGTYERLQRIPVRISTKIRELLKEHGACMPTPLRLHLDEDLEKARLADVPPPF